MIYAYGKLMGEKVETVSDFIFLVSKITADGDCSHKIKRHLLLGRISMTNLLLRQSCLTLCDPIDSSPPGSSITGILQARTLEWVAISFSSTWKWKMKVKSLSHIRLLATPWIAAYQAPPSMGFCRQEYWSGVPLPSPKLNKQGDNIQPWHTPFPIWNQSCCSITAASWPAYRILKRQVR